MVVSSQEMYSYKMIFTLRLNTLPETNIVPENRSSPKGISSFSGAMLVPGSVMSKNITITSNFSQIFFRQKNDLLHTHHEM